MIKKKVLVHGSPKSLREFFSSPFSVEFAPLAIVTDEPINVALALNPARGGLSPEIFAVENLPRFAMQFIDGIVLTDSENRNENINRFAKIGFEPRKIILWNNRGIIEFFNAKDTDGSQVVFMEGLQFHIRNDDDAKFFHQMRGWFQNQRQFYAINPRHYPMMIAQRYENFMGKPLDWDNLQTYVEKMQWIKLYDSTPIKSRLADKFLVRQWITEKIGSEYLIPLLGVWDKFDDINFDALPNQFVLKCNHGSGMNIICRDKKNFDKENAREKLTAWLKEDFGVRFFEPHYSKIPRKIIAEKLMIDEDKPDLDGYKFWCFDGKPFYCGHETGRTADLQTDNMRIDNFDMDWNHTEIENSAHPNSDHPEKILKPKNFELMKELATKICKNFAHVRVDFYEIEGRVYFGEMTFVPGGHPIKWNSKGTDEHFGSLMTLPSKPYKFWER